MLEKPGKSFSYFSNSKRIIDGFDGNHCLEQLANACRSTPRVKILMHLLSELDDCLDLECFGSVSVTLECPEHGPSAHPSSVRSKHTHKYSKHKRHRRL
jgi:hypothetical protein